MCSRRPAANAANMLAASADFGETGGPLLLVAGAQALDDRLLGGKGAVEIAGAHAGGFRDVLHRGGVKAVRGESLLRRFQNALAAFVVRRRRAADKRRSPTCRTFENERSFS